MTAELPTEIQQLIANYKPEKVILFGSRVTGNMHEDSDYDFLIVKETTTRRLNRREEALRNTARTVPLDLIILTPEELDTLKRMNSQFIEEILSTGKVVYEREESLAEIH
jgi:predicted nucleotidyltransferase